MLKPGTSSGIGKSAPLVVTLNEVTEAERALVGGKASNLAALMHSRFPVPPGFCVTATAFDCFLNGCPKRNELSRLRPRLSGARLEQSPPGARKP
jgi:phosphoenolpyruvate synthase/pyruvate phosphate dikinase